MRRIRAVVARAQFGVRGSQFAVRSFSGESHMAGYPWLEHYDAEVPATLAPYPERSLLDYLSETARQWPGRPALLFKGAALTYAQLERLSDSFAAALVALGIRPGDRVAFCLPNCPQFLITEIGA